MTSREAYKSFLARTQGFGSINALRQPKFTPDSRTIAEENDGGDGAGGARNGDGSGARKAGLVAWASCAEGPGLVDRATQGG